MNHHKQILSLVAVGLFTLGAVGVAFGDDDDDDDRGGERSKSSQARADFAPLTNAAYGQECGSCHMAYQPELLPARAWAVIVSPEALSNHYGDDASLTDEVRIEISAYLSANGADRSGGKRAQKFAETARAGSDGSLPRISESPYFVKKHDEIPIRLIKDNPDVGSLSNCNACHRKAAEGDYSEQQINIPGHGPWKD